MGVVVIRFAWGRLLEKMTGSETETQFMEHFCWCLYCVCLGFGCAPCASPCCFTDLKVCCVEMKHSTENCCTEEHGCCHSNSKMCCYLHQCQCPPTLQIGLSCCCIPCCKQSVREPRLVRQKAVPWLILL